MSPEVGVPGNPAHLIQRGPLTSVRIGAHPEKLSIEHALVDTGAKGCFVDTALATRLLLTPIGRKTFVANIHECLPSRIYTAYVQHDDGLHLLSPWRFTAFPIVENMGADFTVILGRDVLSRLEMHYDGLTGSVQVSRPIVV